MGVLARVSNRSWVLVIVVLVGLLVWQGLVWRSDGQAEDRRAEAVQVAKEQVLDLTTLDSEDVGTKLKAMAGRTTGQFKNQVNDIASQFVQIVQEKKVDATGTIDSAAVTSASDRDATVIVASTAVIKEAKKSTTRTYRIRVKLTRGSGAWKISGMEFVQCPRSRATRRAGPTTATRSGTRRMGPPWPGRSARGTAGRSSRSSRSCSCSRSSHSWW